MLAIPQVQHGAVMQHAMIRRRGNVMVYTIIILPAMFAIISLAVDLGRAQLVKMELQRSADATARGYLAMRISFGDPTAIQYAPYLPILNPVDANSGKTATAVITRGSWDFATKAFVAGNGTPFAVRVRVSRTAANNNALGLTWGALLGRSFVDLDAEAVAVLVSQTQGNTTVDAQSDPWLAGMPAGSTASYNDVAGDATQTSRAQRKQSAQQISINVVPGTYITFDNISGAVNHGPGMQTYAPDGEPNIYSHGGPTSPGSQPPVENGIGDVKMPINAFMGVFLDNNQPDSTAAPTDVRDYTTASSRQMASYDDIQKKQPFYIGDGKTGTGTGTIQRFRVPDGATRLFVGIMDGFEWSNNDGNFSVRTTTLESISLVQ